MSSIRSTLLFVPGCRPRFIRTAAQLEADCIILDLEDAVVPAEKESSRILVRRACEALSFGDKEVTVRINSLDTPWGREDLAVAAQLARVNSILIPKAVPETVREVAQALRGSAKGLICLIETALGLQKAFETATASQRVNGLMLGAEDLSVEMNYERTPEGAEVTFARHSVALAAHAAGVQPIDTPFTVLDDTAGLQRDTLRAKAAGFTAKAAISPLHLPVIKGIFTPTSAEVEEAERIVRAAAEGERRGLGAVRHDGKMIDLPVVLRARRVLALAGKEADS